MAEVLLACEALSLDAADGQPVCRDLNLQIAAGQRWAVLGANGSGKTTLLHALAGLRVPRAGRVLLAGRPLTDWPPRQRAQWLGLLTQDHTDPFPSSVLDTALIGRHPHLGRWGVPTADDHACALRALQQVGLQRLAARPVDALSGGERRRLGLATLLTQDTRLLLLDEPANHLDPAHQYGLLPALARQAAAAGRVWLMVTHDPTLASRCCDHALLLDGHGGVLHGPAAALLQTTLLERLYGMAMEGLAGRDGPVFVPLA